jgi:hypothetical protein
MIFGYLLPHRLLGRTVTSTPQPRHGVEGLVLAVLAWQAAGAILPSLHYRVPGPAALFAILLDRYLLPLLPLAVCLALWALPEWRGAGRLWPAWALTAALALVAVAGTRDYLVFQDRVQSLASELDRAGVPDGHLDAGAQWSGEKLYDNRPDMPPSRPDRTWWVNFFAPETDPAYVVSTKPLTGYDVIFSQSYSAWLSPRPGRLLVLRRVGTEIAPQELSSQPALGAR